MPADFNRAWKRVNDILNATAAGTFSTSLSTRDKTRAAAAIEAAGYEAGLTILRAIAEVPNEFRQALITVVNVNSGDSLPAHVGKPSDVEIRRWSGADWREAKQKNYQEVQAYRENVAKIYDAVEHNQQGSSLSGYYDIFNGQIYFTGYACRVGLAQFMRADVTTKIPEVMENVWIKLWVENALKSGEGAALMGIAQYYGNLARAELADFQNGKRTFGEVSVNLPEPAKTP